MDSQNIRYELNDAEEEITQFLLLLGSRKNEEQIKKQIQKLDLQNKIENMNNWNYSVIQIVPLLLKIVMNERMHIYHNILKTIIALLGKLKPDGFISEYAFCEIVTGTPFSKEEVFEELKNREYIENHTLSPNFKPMDERFQFEIDSRFESLKDSILDVLLSIPRDTSTTNALITLLKNQTLSGLYPDIIRALQEIGHPVAIPVLLELVQNNEDSARKALVAMGLKDIKELQQLLEQGVTKDVWGNDLKEKVFVSIRELLPLLLDALTSDEYPVKDKKLICFLFQEMGEHRRSDLEVFVNVLPALYEEQVENCYVTRVLVSEGKKAVSYVMKGIEKGSCEIDVYRRFLFILGEIGPDAAEAIPLLTRLKEDGNPLTGFIQEIIEKIQLGLEIEEMTSEEPVNRITTLDKETQIVTVTSEAEKPDIEDENNPTIDEVQKQNIDADPDDYVLY